MYASLAASLFAAFIAMLGKQWLNRYASIDMRGSAIERSQVRQRKLDGMATWYFNHVLESLPLMLQAALLLLGCALSWYLWEIDITAASVVIGATSSGVLFYTFIIIAGTAWEGCPYQTPWTNIIHRLLHLLATISSLIVEHSLLYGQLAHLGMGGTLILGVILLAAPWVEGRLGIILLAYLALLLPLALGDLCFLGRTTLRALVFFVRGVHNRLFGTSPIPKRVLNYQTTELDFRCISWMLRTSLDKTINLSTLDFLGTILSPLGLNSSINPEIVTGCFNIYLSCIVTGDDLVTTVARGSEQLAGISALYFLRTFSRLPIMGSASTIRDMRQRYRGVFRRHIDMWEIPSLATAWVIHHLFTRRHERPHFRWGDYNPSIDELVPIAHALARVAQIEYHRRWNEPKVPRWVVHFALRFLSQDPLPPTSVVIDCLTIIATDFGCNISNINAEWGEECVCTYNNNQLSANPAPVYGVTEFLFR